MNPNTETRIQAGDDDQAVNRNALWLADRALGLDASNNREVNDFRNLVEYWRAKKAADERRQAVWSKGIIGGVIATISGILIYLAQTLNFRNPFGH